jgi:hypothetical protein
MRKSIKCFFLIGAALFLAQVASANPKDWNIRNCTSDKKLKVKVYNGDDSTCFIAAEAWVLGIGSSASFDCDGGGKKRCKVSPEGAGCKNVGKLNSYAIKATIIADTSSDCPSGTSNKKSVGGYTLCIYEQEAVPSCN